MASNTDQPKASTSPSGRGFSVSDFLSRHSLAKEVQRFSFFFLAHPSARVEADLISTTGVPSNTSIGPIFTRVPSISRTVTGWSPSGFGRAGERV